MVVTADEIHVHLATLCAYPGVGYVDAADAALKSLRCMHDAMERATSASPDSLLSTVQHTIAHFQLFLNTIEKMGIHELEELYTRTFDINPVASLDIGWHLFGENYERGKFLVHMRALLRNNGITESTELPDHLTHVMQVVPIMGSELAERFVVEKVVPALIIILDGLAGKQNPYEHLLYAVRGYLEIIIHTRYGIEHHE